MKEQLVLAHLHTAYPQCNWIKAEAKSKHFDLICTHCGDTVEVKADRMALQTGNVCFEANLFKHTKARRVFYVIGEMAYAWKTESLVILLLLLHAEGKTRSVTGGDGFRNPMILVPMSEVCLHAEMTNLKEEV